MSAVIDPAKTMPAAEKDPADLLGHDLDLNHAWNADHEPLDYIFSSFLTRTAGLIWGQGAVGKTFFLLEAGIAVATGWSDADLMLLFPNRGGKVFYASLEDDARVLNHRLKSIAEHIERITGASRAKEIGEKVQENLRIKTGAKGADRCHDEIGSYGLGGGVPGHEALLCRHADPVALKG